MGKLSDYTRGESKYLRADDLEPGEKIPLTITAIEIEDIENPQSGKSQTKAVAYFRGWPRHHRDKLAEKGLVLNSTNGEVLTDAYGDDIDDQKGKPVVLYRTKTKFGRETVACLRLEIPNDYSEGMTDEPAPQPSKEDIPF